MRTEAQKRAQLKYRQKADKYSKIKEINARSNRKRYNEDEAIRNKKKEQQKAYYLAKKELKEQQAREDTINDELNETEDETGKE